MRTEVYMKSETSSNLTDNAYDFKKKSVSSNIDLLLHV